MKSSKKKTQICCLDPNCVAHLIDENAKIKGVTCTVCGAPFNKDDFEEWMKNKPSYKPVPVIVGPITPPPSTPISVASTPITPPTPPPSSNNNGNNGNGGNNTVKKENTTNWALVALVALLLLIIGVGTVFSYILWDNRKNPVVDTMTINGHLKTPVIIGAPSENSTEAAITFNDPIIVPEVIAEKVTTDDVVTDTITPKSGDTVTTKGNLKAKTVEAEEKVIAPEVKTDKITGKTSDVVVVDASLEVTKDLIVDGNEKVNGDLTVVGNTSLEGDLTVKGNTSLEGDLTVGGDVQIDGNLNVDGKITHEQSSSTTPAVPAVTPTPAPPAPTATPIPGPTIKTGEFDLDPNWATIGDVKVDGIVRYDVGGSGESTIVVNKKTSGSVHISAEWGSGVQWFTSTDWLIKNEFANGCGGPGKCSTVRLVVITDAGTVETFYSK